MRRAGPVLLLVLLLALPLAEAQLRRADWTAAHEDPDAALAPLATVLAQVPRLLEEATDQADRAGEAHAAAVRLDRLRAFTAGLDEPVTWPDGSQAHLIGIPDYALAVQTVAILATAPRDIGILARDRAGCHAWAGNATATELNRWLARTQPAAIRLATTVQALTTTADASAHRTDTTPLRHGAAHLDAWLRTGTSDFDGCAHALAERLDVAPDVPAIFFLTVHPDRLWPTGELLLAGGVRPVPADGVLRLTAAALDLDATVDVTVQGGFHHRHTLPATTGLGHHTITATADDRTATARLTVERAPTRLTLEAPATAAPGADVRLILRVTTVPGLAHALGTGPVRLTGDLDAALPLVDGAAQHTFTAPGTAGLLEGTATYPGTAILAPAHTPWRLRIADPATVAAPEPTLDLVPLLTLGNLLLALAVALPVAAAGLLLARLRRRRRATMPTRLFAADEATEATFQVHPASLLTGFDNLLAYLRARGLATQGTTVREAAHLLARHGTRPRHAVELFERARYGGSPEAPRVRATGTRWSLRVWHLLVRRWRR